MTYNNKAGRYKKHMNGNLKMQNTTSEIKINWCLVNGHVPMSVP